MAVTRLERKGRKNKNVAKNRVNTMKRLNAVPAIKKVDIEEIKAEFAKGSKAAPKATAKKKAKKEEPVAEAAPEKEVKAKVEDQPEAKEETKKEEEK